MKINESMSTQDERHLEILFTQRNSKVQKPSINGKTDPLLRNAPIPFQSPAYYLKSHFKKYLDGDCSVQSMIKTINGTKAQLSAIYRQETKACYLPTDISVDRSTELKQKVSKLKELVHLRVSLKKQQNDQQRYQNLQQVGLFKTLIEGSVQDNKLVKKKNTSVKKLRTLRVHYDNTVIDSSDLNQSFEPEIILDEIEKEKNDEQSKLQRLIRMKIEQKKEQPQFSLFYKNVVTQKDIKLYDYLYNKPRHSEEILNKKIALQKVEQVRPLKYQQGGDSILSGTSSIQDIYESNLDSLYNQSFISRKQVPKMNLTKKIKTLMKLDKINDQVLNITVNKLS